MFCAPPTHTVRERSSSDSRCSPLAAPLERERSTAVSIRRVRDRIELPQMYLCTAMDRIRVRRRKNPLAPCVQNRQAVRALPRTARLVIAAGVIAFLAPASRTSSMATASAHSAPELRRLRYRIDAGQSRFIVETRTTGLSSMFGHDHEIGVRAFTGAISFLPGQPETAVVDLDVRADTLVLLDKDVTTTDRSTIERTIRRSLETTRFPRISFHGDGATAEMVGPDIYQVAMTGELVLHGVRKEVAVSAQVFFRPDRVRIKGSCAIRQTDYRIVPATFVNGTVGVADQVTVSFDLMAPTKG